MSDSAISVILGHSQGSNIYGVSWDIAKHFLKKLQIVPETKQSSPISRGIYLMRNIKFSLIWCLIKFG